MCRDKSKIIMIVIIEICPCVIMSRQNNYASHKNN